MHHPEYESHRVSLSIKQLKYLIPTMIVAQSVASKENLWLKLNKLNCFNLSFLVGVYYNVGLSAKHIYFILERERVIETETEREKARERERKKERRK